MYNTSIYVGRGSGGGGGGTTTKVYRISATDFIGNVYTNAAIAGFISAGANPTLLLQTDNGSGTLMKVSNFVYDATAGSITVAAGNYVITTYK